MRRAFAARASLVSFFLPSSIQRANSFRREGARTSQALVAASSPSRARSNSSGGRTGRGSRSRWQTTRTGSPGPAPAGSRSARMSMPPDTKPRQTRGGSGSPRRAAPPRPEEAAARGSRVESVSPFINIDSRGPLSYCDGAYANHPPQDPSTSAIETPPDRNRANRRPGMRYSPLIDIRPN